MSGDAPGQRRSALTDLHLPSMFRAPQEATGAAHQVREEGHASGTRPPRAQPGATLRATHGAQARARRHYRRAGGRGVPDRSSTARPDRKSTRLNSSHLVISYAVFCLKKKKTQHILTEV